MFDWILNTSLHVFHVDIFDSTIMFLYFIYRSLLVDFARVSLISGFVSISQITCIIKQLHTFSVFFVFFLSTWFTRFTSKTFLQNKTWNKTIKKNNNKEKASNKTMKKHRRYFNNIFWMSAQSGRQNLKRNNGCIGLHGSDVGPYEMVKKVLLCHIILKVLITDYWS